MSAISASVGNRTLQSSPSAEEVHGGSIVREVFAVDDAIHTRPRIIEAGALPNSQSPEAATIGAVIRYHAPSQSWVLVNIAQFSNLFLFGTSPGWLKLV